MTRSTLIAAMLAVAVAAPPALAQSSGPQNPTQQSPQGTMPRSSQDAAQQQQQRAARQPDQQPSRSAQMLEDRIFVRLAEDAWAGGDFDVQVDGDTVTLTGTVPTEQSKQRMLRITRRTPGVAEVRDNLRVDPSVGTPPTATVDDNVLAQRVARQIASRVTGAKAGEDWWLTGWRVEGPDNRWTFTVEAENGNVWLEGEVPQYSYIRQAIDAARDTAGVRSVRSNLELNRNLYPYGYTGRYPGYAYAPYGPYGYGYGDRDYYFLDIDRDGNRAADSYHGYRGLHAVTGEVMKIDRQKGMLTLRTQQQGTLELPFPQNALQNVNQGDRITVELGMKPASTGGAASPRTDSGGPRQGMQQNQQRPMAEQPAGQPGSRQ